MNPPPNREVALFSAALELPASEPSAYLDKACADDPALRLRLVALLRIHEHKRRTLGLNVSLKETKQREDADPRILCGQAANPR